MKYRIKIEELVPYDATKFAYKDKDGKIHESRYNIPEEKRAELEEVYVKTGKTEYDNREILAQEIDELDLIAVIKAINNL